MKRYLVFGGKEFFPAGGWNDLRGQFNTHEEASAATDSPDIEWWQIIDLMNPDESEEGEN
jgi:hypothetical protein